MGFPGMTVATIYQSFPTPPLGLVLGLKFGDVFRFDVQTQVSTYLVKGFAYLKAEQQAFHILSFLDHG
jgi:hypothetical protein